jgi:PAS domain S-box-containing protein
VKLRFSPSRVALAYIALSVLALGLFAVPLWYGYRANIGTFRAYVPGDEVQRLVDLFHHEGASALASEIESKARSTPRDEVILFADSSNALLAGNLPAWPAEVPAAPGSYGLVISLGGGTTMRVVASHVTLPGGYQLLMGRESVRFESLVERFWYGIGGAVAIVLALGAAFAWQLRRSLLSEVNEISRSAAAIVQGDLSRRLPARGSSAELDTLAQTVNGMLEQLARAQRRSEVYLAEAQRLSHTGSFSWRPATGELNWSEETFRILGYSADPQPTLDLARRRIHPDDLALCKEAARRATREEGEFELEHRLLMPGGAVKHLRVVGHTALDESGKPAEVRGAVMDVTAERLAQRDLEVALRDIKASEAELRRIIDTIPMQVWCALPDGSTEFQNRRWLEYSGLSAEQARGWGWRDAVHPQDVDAYTDRWLAIHASQAPGESEARFRRFDGEYRWFLSRVAPVHDERGKVVKWYGANADIEDRKHAEALLAGEKRLLEMVARGTPAPQILDALCRFVEQTAPGCLCGITLVDPGGTRLEHGAAPSLPASYNDGIHGRPVNVDSGPCAMAAFLKEQVITPDIAAETRWKEYEWCAHALAHGLRACWSTPILSSTGKALGAFALYFREPRSPAPQHLGLIEQLTHLASIALERAEAEQALRRSERQRRQAQRLEAMGTLAGGIAHDFNNILGAILGFGEMALRDASKGTRLRRDLDSVMAAGERGRALVERILAFSRSGVGERVPVHVEKVVREALDLLEAKLPEGIRVEARLEAGRAAMLGDPTQVHQVLMNLGMNAMQAMGSGGTLSVTLDVSHLDAARAATIGTVAAADYVVLKVADTGSGIEPEIVERIFDPFFSTKGVSVGTGLGLSLVHGIVTEVGGAIEVASKPGAGSAFTVYLPRAGDAADAPEDAEPSMPRGNRERVLVVDDEEPLVRLATRTLEELSYLPVGFTSSLAALDAFRAAPANFDAVITDERMPGLSGSALIREVRLLRSSIPIVLMSGYTGGLVHSRALESGADEVLQKPLKARELATSLARVLRP